MRIGSLKLGERIIKDEKMVVCQKLFQAAYLPLWRIALLLFHLLYNCFPVFRLPFVGRLLMNKAACVAKRRCEAKIKMERRLIAKWCVQLGLKGCQDVGEPPTRQRLQV